MIKIFGLVIKTDFEYRSAMRAAEQRASRKTIDLVFDRIEEVIDLGHKVYDGVCLKCVKRYSQVITRENYRDLEKTDMSEIK